jgi:hypothetical protein
MGSCVQVSTFTQATLQASNGSGLWSGDEIRDASSAGSYSQAENPDKMLYERKR